MTTPLELAQLQMRLRMITRGLAIDCAESAEHVLDATDGRECKIEHTRPDGTLKVLRVPFWDLIALARLATVPLDAGQVAAFEAAQSGLKQTPRQRETERMIANLSRGLLGTDHQKVVAILEAAGTYGLTDYELEHECGSHNANWRSRRAELVQAGLVIDSQEVRLVNLRKRKVWKLARHDT